MKTHKQNKQSPMSAGFDFTPAAVMLALLAGGCVPEMDPVSLVEKTRVLGARVEVDGAPDRSTPRPGESVNVAWLVTAPQETPPLGWAFVLCPGVSGGNNLGCVGEPFAVFQGKDAPAQMTITVPAREALGQAAELVLFGRICAASVPVMDPSGRPRCSDDADGTTAAVSISLERDDWSNRNPGLGDGDALSFAGQPWPAQDEAAACAQLPQVKAASKDQVIRLQTEGADRETFVVMQGDPPRPTSLRERLQISQFTTAGKLERAFSTVEADDNAPRPAIEVKWEAPGADKVPALGLVVRFTFVARDMRGGLASATRSVCVTP